MPPIIVRFDELIFRIVDKRMNGELITQRCYCTAYQFPIVSATFFLSIILFLKSGGMLVIGHSGGMLA